MIKAAFLEFWDARIDLPTGESIVGRGPFCDVQLQDAAVSREHLKFLIGKEVAVVEDLASTNGTLLNGKPLTGRHSIGDGDVLQFGHGVFIFRVEDDQAKQSNEPLRELADAFVSRSQHERRTDPRFPTSFPVRVACTEGALFDGVAWDLSMGGMFIACSSVDTGIDRCRITLMPDDTPPLDVAAVVRHVIKSATIQGHPPGLGVRFEKLAEETARWLDLNVGQQAATWDSDSF
jgi:hypothetical protein